MFKYNYLIILMFTLCRGFRQLDTWKFEEGRRQYDVVDRNRNMPKYGQCWTRTVEALQSECREITDELQTRLALAYLNCFLMTQGRQPYSCEGGESLQTCTHSLADSDRSSLATFFTHTHNICYFLQSQVWQENTENAITRLSARSDKVAVQLKESSQLQQEIIQQQNLSLSNQKSILSQAANLSLVINESTTNIHELFGEYQKTTSEQRVLINDIFDRVSKIQSTIIGEFVGFYSVLIYTLAIIICYLLTSTARTSCARFPLFGIVTLNFCIEKGIISWIVDSSKNLTRAEEADQNERLYQYQWMCREVSSVFGFLVLLLFAYKYKDLSTINNQLLVDIRKQNLELKQALQDDRKKKRKENSLIDDRHVITIPNKAASETGKFETESNINDDSDDYGYHSHTHMPIDTNNHVICKESPISTSHSYPDTDTCSESSFTTALSGKVTERSQPSTRSSSRSSTVQRELENLQDVSKFTKLRENILNWTTHGCYDTGTLELCQENTEANLNITEYPSKVQSSKVETPVIRRYNMRKRTPRGTGNSQNRSNL